MEEIPHQPIIILNKIEENSQGLQIIEKKDIENKMDIEESYQKAKIRKKF